MPVAALTRQRKFQLRNAKLGRCETCSRPAFKAKECRRHYVLRRMRRLGYDDQMAEQLTRFILQAWASYEAEGLPMLIGPIPAKALRFMERWERRMVVRR